MKQVVVTGSVGYDYIMDFPGRFADRIMPDKIYVLSLSFLVDKFTKQFGGVATNLAISAGMYKRGRKSDTIYVWQIRLLFNS